MSPHHTKESIESQSESQSNSSLFSGIYPVHKERGETLAVLLERFRMEYHLDVKTKLTYAGRLDPMAEGIVLVLAGESRFQKDKLLGLSKVYEVDVLLGIATDTLDPLGIITSIECKDIDAIKITDAIAQMHTIISLPYPMYSSALVDGTPLFAHARAGNSVKVPYKNVTITKADLLGIKKESIEKLAIDAIQDIQKVVGDFRQEEIIQQWQKLIDEGDQEATMVSIRIEASSGTYMRSLAEWLGQRLGVPALAFRIKRVLIGEYGI